MKVEVGIATVDRPEHLAALLCSLINQTHQEWDLTIIADSLVRKDLRENACFNGLFKLMEEKGHRWRVLYGSHKGWHHAQQMVLNSSEHPLTFIVDDDQLLDIECIKYLHDTFMDPMVGAAGSLFLLPGDRYRAMLVSDWETDERYNGKIYVKKEKGVGFGSSLQYVTHQIEGTEIFLLEPKEVEHLIGGCLLYRTEVGRKWGFNLGFNYTARCSDELFTYMFFKNGYKCLVVPKAIVWHFPTSQYGKLDKESSEYIELCKKNRTLFEKEVIRLNQ